MMPRRRRKRPSCVIELYLHGLLYVRVERIPRWLANVFTTALSVIGTWWLTRR
jgi:hypothetical protein